MKKIKEKINCIYRIYSKSHPEREYYGSALDFNSRKYQHFFDLKKQRHCNSFLQNHYNKYGEFDLVMEIVEVVPLPIPYDIQEHKRNLLLREQYYLDIKDCFFNICKIAGSKMGVPTSEEAKRKMSLKNKGQKRSEDFRRRASEINKGNKIWLGRKHSMDSRQKISQVQIGKTLSEEHRKNISKGSMGRVQTEETRKKLSEATKGKPKSESARKNMSISAKNRPPISEETRQKLSQISKERIRTDEWKAKIAQSNSRSILQYDLEHNLVQEFIGAKTASNITGIGRTSIVNALSGKSKTAGGFIWEYAKS